VARILAGSRDRTILDRGFDSHPNYAALEALGTTGVFRLADSLERIRALKQTGDHRYPTVAITATGRRILSGIETAELDFPQGGVPGKKSKGTSSRPRKRGPSPGGGGGALYERLVELRAELAKERRMPAYRIFPNSTLRALAEFRPATVEDAMDIKGVGETKAETVLEPFLEAIRRAEEDDD
jgi:ATP-dependent DNA helicase RecQ